MLGVIIHIDALVIWLTWKFRDGKDCWHSISIGWTGDTKVLPLSLCRRSSPCNGPWSWSWWLRQSKHFVASFGDKECSEMIRMRLKDLDMERFQNVLELVEMIWATFFCWNSEKTRTTGGTLIENSNRELVSWCFLMVYHEVLQEQYFHIFPRCQYLSAGSPLRTKLTEVIAAHASYIQKACRGMWWKSIVRCNTFFSTNQSHNSPWCHRPVADPCRRVFFAWRFWATPPWGRQAWHNHNWRVAICQTLW